MPAKVVLTDEQKQAILGAYGSGLTIRQTADRVGVSPFVARGLLRRAKVIRKPTDYPHVREALADNRAKRHPRPVLSDQEVERLRRAVGGIDG